MRTAKRGGRRGIAALAVMSLVLGVLAFFHKGVPAAQMQFNDGGVWVINQALKLVGHLNYPSRTLDGGVRAGSGDFDVAQDRNSVVVKDSGSKKAQNLDTAAMALGDGAPIGGDTALAIGGQTAVVTDAAEGKVWVLPVQSVGGFRGQGDATVDKVSGVRAVVSLDGVVYLVTPDGVVRTVKDGQAVELGTIKDLKGLGTAALTVVGDTVVVLDRDASTVRTLKGSAPVTGADKLVIQQPGPASDKVLLAGASTMISVPLVGGTGASVENGAGPGVPAAPAVLDGCSYFAWGGSGAYVRDCVADADDAKQTVEKMKGSTKPSFRVNRDIIVFNDLASGLILLVNAQMTVLENWVLIDSSVKKQDEKQSTTEVVDESMNQPCAEQTALPAASPDSYGVRAGRTYTLPVLENDTVPNCSMLTAIVKAQPTGAKVSQVRGGEALSIAVPPGASGTLSFDYTADDGHGAKSEASVKVTVYPPSVNEAPKQTRVSSMVLGRQGEASTSVLGDWMDPEGDSLFVVAATGTPDLLVRARPDGVLSVRDLGTGGPGPKDVDVVVSDGQHQSTGKLRVTVRSDNKVPPVTNTDHVTVLKGQDVMIRPLANDVDPNGGTLRLTRVLGQSVGQTVQPDYVSGLIRFSSSAVGTAYLQYEVIGDAAVPATGTIRVDVAEPVQGDPVPSDDVAMLPTGGSVVVDALGNDTDPAGGVLVLKSVTVPPNVGVAVEVLDHHLLRISAPVGLDAPVDLGYVVSNGTGQATGRVSVVPLPPVASDAAPIAVNDKMSVRVGDIVTVPVLGNDRSPSGLPLSLDPKVEIEGDQTVGDAFVSRDVVRFRAKKAGSYRITYTARDTAKNYSSAQIIVSVTPLDSPNQPPVPEPIEGRVLAGGKVVIPVPLDGADPDGDSVTLVGLSSAASLGAAEASSDGITYTASAGAAGTDTFTYEVQDRFGAKASSTVRVGIAPPNTNNQSPVAVPDDLSTRPGRLLTVKPIGNDVDPDGDVLSLIGNSVSPADSKTTVETTIDGDQVTLKTPDAEGVLTYYYGVSDGNAGTDKGVITVHVSKDAPLKAPIAVDDIVTPEQIKSEKTVTVDVLANDYDPDGSTKELALSTQDSGASVVDRKLVITVTDQRQVILYSLKDPDGNVGKAAVIVPPAGSDVPTLNMAKLPATVQAGELLTLPLADYVVVRPGRSPLVTFEAKAKAGVGSDGTVPVKDAKTLQYKSVPEFAGMTSVTFEVTDGTSAEDASGRTATLSLPIRVTPPPAVNHPPVFTPSDVTVAVGEAPKSADLKQMAKDPDPGDANKLSFNVGAVTGPFKVDLSGSTINVSADASVPPGTAGSVQVTVSDGTNPPVPGTIPLKASASTRPLMSVKTAVISDAKAGSPSTIDLTQYISNPFAAEGKPVTIVGTPSASVAGTSVEVSGLSVKITPPTAMHGSLLVTYVAQDATQQSSRQVRGTIELTVRDKPDAPVGVIGETHLSRTVTLNWAAGANNGAEIDFFTVKWTGNKGSKSSQKCSKQTTCTVTSLVNDETYVFTVSATNVVGEGPDSGPSAGLRPDVKPNPPGAPVGTFGDKQVTLTWPAATTDGSPVTSYTVQVSPATATGTTVSPPVTGTSYVFAGLTNGVAYTFRAQAHSAAAQPSDWSIASAPVIPAGPPLTPAAPKATKQAASTLPPSATVSWTPPGGNGDTNFVWELSMNGSVVPTCAATTALSCNVTLAVSSTDVTFTVRVKNKAGWSTASPASNAIRPFKDPGPVTNLTASPTGTSNQVNVSFSAAAGNGALPSEMTYRWRSSNGGSGTVGSTGGTLTNATAFPNGSNVTLYVWAESTVKGELAKGPETGVSVNAYGPPTTPTMSCSGSGTTVSCSWSGGSDGGRSTTYTLSNLGSGNVGVSGSKSWSGLSYGTTYTVCIEAKQSTGVSGGVKCDTGTTAPPPPQVQKVSVNGLTVTLSFYNFANAGTWNVRCWNAPTWEQRKWPVISGGVATSAGNYLGEPGLRNLPSTGTITFTCPGNQYDPTMRPNADFSIEFQGAVPNWYHIGP